MAKDGSAQYSTIGAALVEATLGTTIRILDKATYRETLAITSASRHAGLVLEATGGATLEVAQVNGVGILIEGVPRVTVRGLKFRSEAARVVMVQVRTSAPGLLLENLEMGPGAADEYDGIYLEMLQHSEADAPAVVRQCLLDRGKFGISVQGLPIALIAASLKYPAARQCARVLVQDNGVAGFHTGILALGQLSHVHIVGNRIWGGARYSAIQLENMHPDSQDVLVANNTVLECPTAFRLWDDGVKGRGVALRNNLVLGTAQPDMLFIDNGGSPVQLKGPGDVSQIAKKWQMDHNWREARQPTGQDVFSLSWIPPGAQDVRREEIAVLSRAPNDGDFLRPAKDSPLASGGAGGDLPGYVGAVPPEGQPRWDWQRTWQGRSQATDKSPSGP